MSPILSNTVSRASIRTDSISYEVTRKRWYATTTFLTALFVGGAIALAVGESITQQLGATVVIATMGGGGSYWILCRLAAAVTGGTGHYRIAYPTPEPEREPDGSDPSDRSRQVDAR